MDERSRERAIRRFLMKVDKNGPVPGHRPDLGPCWLWKPLGTVGGYGTFYMNGRGITAHRAAYELFVAPIPEGLVIDHLCRVRNCVRHSHLEPVTTGENTRRAQAWLAGAAWQREKTHCPYGHPYSGDNLRICKDGKRACRTCERRATAEYRARKRAANPPQPKPPKTHCKNGHAFAEWGRTTQDGHRVCRKCAAERVREYQQRARALKGPQPERVTCKNGHPWIPENIYLNKRGHKQCRACHNERSAERYRALRAKRETRPRPQRETCANGHPWSGGNLYITPDGLEKCRECARNRGRKYEAKLKASRPPAVPKPPRTHCPYGHELAGDNLYIAPSGGKFCRKCAIQRATEYQRRRREGLALASPAKSQWQRDKTHCPAGHEYSPENTYEPPSGGRKCRECIRVRTREYQRRKRGGGKAA